ncbi:hypothetical protein V1283_007844 [Bradyrhizobium sp. AZCC 2262]
MRYMANRIDAPDRPPYGPRPPAMVVQEPASGSWHRPSVGVEAQQIGTRAKPASRLIFLMPRFYNLSRNLTV